MLPKRLEIGNGEIYHQIVAFSSLGSALGLQIGVVGCLGNRCGYVFAVFFKKTTVSLLLGLDLLWQAPIGEDVKLLVCAAQGG